jgi:hypothetical protein
MSEVSQAERIAALQAKRAPLTFVEGVDVTATPSPSLSPVRTWRQIAITKPAPQRVVATGVSVVSFAAMAMAMGPLTTQTVETADGDDAQVDAAAVDPTIAQVPAVPPEVVVEVIPNYIAVSEDGTLLPAGVLLPDGTLAAPANTGAPVELPDEETQQVLAANAAPAGTVAAAAPTATAAPPTAPPATSATPKAAAPAATAAPKAVAPAATAAPATAAPATTAAPAATNPPPPPKSEASG